MCEFLAGNDLSQMIREVVSGKDARCAVAFWGQGAVRELFGTDVLERNDVHVVCDLSMGGSNPATLRALGAPKNPKIKYLDGLHAKVFLSERGAVVGSANASNNGIGFFGREAELLEAGTYFSKDSVQWCRIGAWFDQLIKNEASEIDQDALRAADLSWQTRTTAHNILPACGPRHFRDYNSRDHGLVYVLWHMMGDDGPDYDDGVAVEFPNQHIQDTTHLAPNDDDLRGNWVCCFRVNNDGTANRRENPIFFFANSLVVGGAAEADPEYGDVLGQNPHGIIPQRPFDFNDRFFIQAFQSVINNPIEIYAGLRGVVRGGHGPWLARDHVELMHKFWSDVRTEYCRITDER